MSPAGRPERTPAGMVERTHGLEGRTGHRLTHGVEGRTGHRLEDRTHGLKGRTGHGLKDRTGHGLTPVGGQAGQG